MSFGKPEMGRNLLRLARLFTPQGNGTVELMSMHISPRYDVSPDEAKKFEAESFRLVKEESVQLELDVKTRYFATEDVSDEIITYTSQYAPDLLLLGAAQSLFSHDMLGGKIGKILQEVRCDTLVLSEKGLALSFRARHLLQPPRMKSFSTMPLFSLSAKSQMS